MKLGITNPSAGGGAPPPSGGAAWQSTAGRFEAVIGGTGILNGDRFYMRSRDPGSSFEIRVSGGVNYNQTDLWGVYNQSVRVFFISSYGSLNVGASADQFGVSLTQDRAAIAHFPDLSGAETYEFDWCAGNARADRRNVFFRAKLGTFAEWTTPRRPSGTIGGAVRPTVRFEPDVFRIFYGDESGYLGARSDRFVLTEPDTETAKIEIGNTSTSASATLSRRGLFRMKSRKATGDLMPGCLVLEDKSGVKWYFWMNSAGALRVSSTDPRGNENSGSPV